MATSEAARLARLRAQIINSKDLPTIPVLLARIVAVVDGERSSTRDLVEVMQRDQALSGRVLRLANSGFFGFAREVSTVSRAVMILGFGTVRSLALGVKVWESFMTGASALKLAELWEHSALVGAAARLVAQRTRAADPEEIFTAGLLHDIGRTVLALRFPAEYAAVVYAAASDPATPLVEHERAAFGIDHAQAGAWLAETWGLPPTVVESAAMHEETIAPGMPLRPWVLVNLANQLVHWTDLDAGAIDPAAERQLDALGAAGPSLPVWVEIAALLQGQKSDLRQFFGGVG
jgi:putative nucleotidyltransferase with HDIG domain